MPVGHPSLGPTQHEGQKLRVQLHPIKHSCTRQEQGKSLLCHLPTSLQLLELLQCPSQTENHPLNNHFSLNPLAALPEVV